MNDELLKILSAPGAVGVMMIWLHTRLNKVETRMELLATHLNAPTPKKSKLSSTVRCWLALAFLIAWCAGCTFTRQCTSPGVCSTHISISTNLVPMILNPGQ